MLISRKLNSLSMINHFISKFFIGAKWRNSQLFCFIVKQM
ncbi:hypothetical protein GBAG_2527 [Buttiauxella agrestis ATCC 33320]|uniref:Uncharacterized protein n=1 Tax=Buttiauxella agrestis ATCC 33320 TaxID=1006004 RepID=A0A085GBZ8_9ENTR|nr:hypothetical protein GBAG_2527 [Buttiauxella agrestis ATCC 33320]